MSNHSIDPERAALITERMAQAFAFAHDVIDAPSILEGIPDGSTLLFRDIEHHGDRVRLIAHPSPDRPGGWTARVTGPAHFATASRRWDPPVASRGMGGKWSGPLPFPEHAPTAPDALNVLRTSSASRIDPGHWLGEHPGNDAAIATPPPSPTGFRAPLTPAAACWSCR